MPQPEIPRTVRLTLTADRGMLLVQDAGNAGTFVLAMPDDLCPVAERLRELVADPSIPAFRPGSIDWNETAKTLLGAIAGGGSEGAA